MRHRVFYISTVVLIIWITLHFPSIIFGTQNLALHQAYVGDEQSPINGALHVLQDQSLLGLRNLNTLYYGPVFAVIALPAVVGDFLEKQLRGLSHGADGYKNYILFDWGGIVWKARIIAVLCSFIGLMVLYKLLMTVTVNPKQNHTRAFVGTVLLACNFFFFVYASFFRHWIFLLTALLLQLYLLVRIHENPDKARTYFILQGFIAGLSFGLSYLALLSQIIFIPPLIQWIKNKNRKTIVAFCWYVCLSISLAIIMMIWHPHAFMRVIGLVSGDMFGINTALSNELRESGLSFIYYGQILLYNHIALLLALGILLRVSWKEGFAKTYLIWTTLSSATVFYLIFGVISHHESRYILPVILLLVVTTAILFVRHYSELSRMVRIIVITLFVCYLVFHGVTIFHWLNLMKVGPSEKIAIAEAIQYQNKHPEAKQLFIGWNLVGYVHTSEAYKDYEVRFKKDVNLYKALYEAKPIANTTPLNIYYVYPNEPLNLGELKSYDRIVYQYRPNTEQIIAPDYLEVYLVRYWVSPNIWLDGYSVIKE